MMTSRERVVVLPDATRLAVRLWGAPEEDATLQVLAIHGWMDTAGSFDALAPALIDACGGASCVCVAALDLPGHGRSSHLPREGGSYSTPVYAAAVAGAATALGWTRAIVVGHSMGGGCAVLFAGAFPERVRGVALLESSGPPHRADEEAPDLFARAVLAAALGGGKSSIYPTVEDAARARAATAKAHPGSQSLSMEAARALVARALVPADPSGGAAVRFAHDSRIKAPALLSCSESQVSAFLSRIAAASIPTLIVSALHGWPYPPDVIAERCARLAPVLSVVKTAGSHHAHLDPETAPTVAAEVARWVNTVVRG